MSNINPRLFTNHTSSPNLFNQLSARLEDIALDIGVIGFPALSFESKYKRVLNSEDDLLQLTKKALNEKIGSELVGLSALNDVATEAIKDRYTGKVVPIILNTKDEELALDLSSSLKRLTPNVLIITVGKTENSDLKERSLSNLKSVKKETVEKSLMKIRENLK